MTANMNNNGLTDEEISFLASPSKPELRSLVMAVRRDSAPLISSSRDYASRVHAHSFPPYESIDDAVFARPFRQALILNTCGVLNTPPTTRNCSWRHPELRPVGQYHLVSKNSAYVHQHELPTVLERLQATFQAASCKCDNGDNRVKCVTLEETEFVVSFWTKDSAVLIEMDRIAGDGIIFHSRYVPLVMQAIRGASTRPISPASAQTGTGALDTQYLHDVLSRIPAATLPPGFCDVMSYVEDALDLVADMLASDRCDVSGLGLESLAIMTDPAKSSPGVAVAVSRVILTGSTSKGKAISHRNSKIQQHVVCLALTGHFGRTDIDTFNGADMNEARMAAPHAYKSLTILANAVTMASTEDVVSFVHNAEQLPGVHSVVDRLLALVRSARQSPHSAFLATHILAALVHEHSVESEGINVDTIQEAQSVGTCSHAALAQASHRLLTNLSAATAS